MSTDSEHRLEESFSATRDLGPPERAACLSRAGGGDPTLRRQADSLPAAHEQVDVLIGSAAQSPNTHSRGSMLWWVIDVLVLYVLSTGPVVKLAAEGQISGEAIESIYAPIDWLCKTPVGERLVRPSIIWYGNTIWRWGFPLK